MTRVYRFGTVSGLPVFGFLFVFVGVLNASADFMTGVWLVLGFIMLGLGFRIRLQVSDRCVEVRNVRNSFRFESKSETLEIMIPKDTRAPAFMGWPMGVWFRDESTGWILSSATRINRRAVRPGHNQIKELEVQLRALCPNAEFSELRGSSSEG